MRNIDVLNKQLQKFSLPTHRSNVPESMANLDWLRKNLTKKNDVDKETLRLLSMSPNDLRLPYDQ